ncbi:uncharacterized protein LOC143196971 [Rhynchophorus ferrugineus]|uniref:uncharacterized protein LOC143196971 n=1 Tax=Rhynchophorus ferrugineus TaxID=354439 RepID=UPI003FCEE193
MDLSSASSLTFDSSPQPDEPGPSTQTRTSLNINRPPSFIPLFANFSTGPTPQSSTTPDCPQLAPRSTATTTDLPQSVALTPQTISPSVNSTPTTATHSTATPSTTNIPIINGHNTSSTQPPNNEEYLIPVETINPLTYLICFRYPSNVEVNFATAVTYSSSTSDAADSRGSNSSISTSDKCLHRSDGSFTA